MVTRLVALLALGETVRPKAGVLRMHAPGSQAPYVCVLERTEKPPFPSVYHPPGGERNFCGCYVLAEVFRRSKQQGVGYAESATGGAVVVWAEPSHSPPAPEGRVSVLTQSRGSCP